MRMASRRFTRLYAANNRKIADSGEGYWNKADAQNGINLVKSTNSATPVYER
ncbi:YegP family protein [Bradyrhizobium tunisiense]|uniref:YegP family protein n=1 Tax=Bradyrhizobium tunisiense TaxID=3278709 RepID=UPI0035DAC3FC